VTSCIYQCLAQAKLLRHIILILRDKTVVFMYRGAVAHHRCLLLATQKCKRCIQQLASAAVFAQMASSASSRYRCNELCRAFFNASSASFLAPPASLLLSISSTCRSMLLRHVSRHSTTAGRSSSLSIITLQLPA